MSELVQCSFQTIPVSQQSYNSLKRRDFDDKLTSANGIVFKEDKIFVNTLSVKIDG